MSEGLRYIRACVPEATCEPASTACTGSSQRLATSAILQVHLQNRQVKFVYQDHQLKVKVKVTGPISSDCGHENFITISERSAVIFLYAGTSSEKLGRVKFGQKGHASDRRQVTGYYHTSTLPTMVAYPHKQQVVL